MKGILRWSIRIVAILWIMLCMIPLAIWIVGRSSFNPLDRTHLGGSWFVELGNSRHIGCVGMTIYRDWPSPSVSPPLAPGRQYTPEVLQWYRQQPTGVHYRRYGFGYDRDTYFFINGASRMVAAGRHIRVGIPYWAAIAVWTPVIVGLLWRRYRAFHAIPPGHCRTCGYDLRATPERCPECGTEVARASIS